MAVVTDVLRNLEEPGEDRKSTRLNSSHSQISYAVFCLKKKNPERSSPATAWYPPYHRASSFLASSSFAAGHIPASLIPTMLGPLVPAPQRSTSAHARKINTYTWRACERDKNTPSSALARPTRDGPTNCTPINPRAMNSAVRLALAVHPLRTPIGLILFFLMIRHPPRYTFFPKAALYP